MNNTNIHAAQCDIWEIQDSTDSLNAVPPPGYSPETAQYLTGIRPVYDSLGRVMAQLSGIFLLYLSSQQRELPLDHSMFNLAKKQLDDCAEQLRAIRVPYKAARHHGALSEMCQHLQQVSKSIDSIGTHQSNIFDDIDTRHVMRQLNKSQQCFIATSEPGANLSPVDFSHACCSCGVSKGA
ncbi:hypothetical protein IT895_05700 [Halomonas sp. A40-4]|uniref:hypothetical protein n=1 Tax=Halomonas sp. A40-4 TaxID=2785909 RepID=UPI0018EF7E84|nr:hypothetical protein [Halomonas sp. A40-4]QPL47271.1 hypothetical protein IT895_05700 [Halomonas sp. A40-4]